MRCQCQISPRIAGAARRVAVLCAAKSMRERPEAKLFLGDLPQAREAIWLDDQEKDDQSTEYDHLEIGHQARRQREAQEALQGPRKRVEKNRQQRDESGAEERPQ